MKMMNVTLALLLTGLWACEKPDTIPPVTHPEGEVFELIWATRLDPSEEVVGSDMQQVYKEHFITFGDLDKPATIFGYNTSTGDLDWTYQHSGSDVSNIDFNYLANNILLCVTGKRVFAFDLETRAEVWEIDLVSKGLLRGSGVLGENDKFYLAADFAFGTPSQVQHLLEIDVHNGSFSMVLSLPPDSLGIKSISPPAFWHDSANNRTLMILNEYPDAQLPPEQDHQNILAIDLETKEVVWKTENFTENFYSNSLHPPILHNNTVITGGDWSIYAFDVRTGEKLWRYEFDYPWAIWTKTNHLVHDGRLYVNNSQEDVTCLDPATGQLIWNNPKGGANCTDNMVYYEKEDLLVFTSWGYGSVMVLDALTGETLHREHRYDDSSYNNDVVYDPATDMFFTSTYKHAVGFKVARPK